VIEIIINKLILIIYYIFKDLMRLVIKANVLAKLWTVFLILTLQF